MTLHPLWLLTQRVNPIKNCSRLLPPPRIIVGWNCGDSKDALGRVRSKVGFRGLASEPEAAVNFFWVEFPPAGIAKLVAFLCNANPFVRFPPRRSGAIFSPSA